jgi:murein DD-endopeptidase MepM/ murein hydrolase activator NlpD
MYISGRIQLSFFGIALLISAYTHPKAIIQSRTYSCRNNCAETSVATSDALRTWIREARPDQVVQAYSVLFTYSPELAQSIPCLPPLGDWSGNRISSGFGVRTHPTLHTQRHHDGIDIAGPNQYVRAAASGQVEAVAYSRSLGRYVRVDHGNSYHTVYGHLALQSVQKGQQVRVGETLGITGSTGRATGIHLHYSVLKHNVPINPADYLLLAIRFVNQYQKQQRRVVQAN